MREFFNQSTCVPCIEIAIDAQCERGDLDEHLHLLVDQALGTLRSYCTEMEYVCIDSDQMASWLSRHGNYEELLYAAFDEACETCVHQGLDANHSWMSQDLEERDYPIMPKGQPHPRWRDVFERGERIGVCLTCIEDEENIQAFVENRYIRNQPQIPPLIRDLVQFCRDEFDQSGRVPIEVPSETYMAWVENQNLTAPWYAFSVTARYLWRFLRSCDHMYNDFTTEFE